MLRTALGILLVSVSAFAQDSTHNFFDKPARFSLAGTVTLSAWDNGKTCYDINHGYQEVFLAVKQCPGISLWNASRITTQFGTAYLLHRHAHHKLERIVEVAGMLSPAIGLAYSYAHQHDMRYIPPHSASGVNYLGGWCIVGHTC